MALTDKQEMFCREYLIDLNATQAAIRAGYSARTANRTASENLSKPDIQSRIAELKAQRNDLVGINATYVLNRLVEIDQMDVLDILSSIASMGTAAAIGLGAVAGVIGANLLGKRKNGGPVTAGGMYQVGEGGMPEIYQANTGKQYMIPGDNGKVISNKDMCVW